MDIGDSNNIPISASERSNNLIQSRENFVRSYFPSLRKVHLSQKVLYMWGTGFTRNGSAVVLRVKSAEHIVQTYVEQENVNWIQVSSHWSFSEVEDVVRQQVQPAALWFASKISTQHKVGGWYPQAWSRWTDILSRIFGSKVEMSEALHICFSVIFPY